MGLLLSEDDENCSLQEVSVESSDVSVRGQEGQGRPENVTNFGHRATCRSDLNNAVGFIFIIIIIIFYLYHRSRRIRSLQVSA